MMKLIRYISVALVFNGVFVMLSCSSKQPVRVLRQKVAAGSGVAVLVDGPNNIKNVVLSRFMGSNFKVVAFNAADLYAMKDVFDIRDFKKVSHTVAREGDGRSLASMERTFDNVYKLHVYNFEINKAETLREIRRNWNVNYLVLLELKDWEEVSWGRAINLDTFELIWVENYPARYNDDPVTIVDHFIRSMTGR
ncbi:MAG TPA: hypothetical protein PK200_01450 [Spirochaetota bacterium]|nr:hypothetical protein [Spirochaetota bacterium]HQO02473.1 hypothetical protein [Spirochaetota bacterium]